MKTQFLNIKKRLVSFFSDQKNLWARNLLWFFVLVIVITGLLRLWQETLNYWPLDHEVSQYSNKISINLTLISSWIFQHVFHLRIEVSDTLINFANDRGMLIGEYCSGFKQTLLFIFLILIFPGPWKKKLWFVPFGIICLHLTNVLRVTVSGLTLSCKPDLFNLVHDQIFKTVYFIVIFFLWLWWAVRLSNKKQHSTIS